MAGRPHSNMHGTRLIHLEEAFQRTLKMHAALGIGHG